MAIKVIAQRREVKLGKNPQEKKVFSEAATHSGREVSPN